MFPAFIFFLAPFLLSPRKVLIVVALLVGLGVVISLFKKHAKPS